MFNVSDWSSLLESKCKNHASTNLALVRLISKSSPFSLAVSTISAFFILFKADLDKTSVITLPSAGISSISWTELTSFLDSLGASELPNNLAKKPFFFLSLLSLIIIA